MPIDLRYDEGEGILNIALVDTISKKDYRPFAAEILRLASNHGKLSTLLDMTSFQSWDADALWDEAKFDIRHLDKFHCLAVVGESRAQQIIACYIRPLIPAKVAYFDSAQFDDARHWVNSMKVTFHTQAA